MTYPDVFYNEWDGPTAAWLAELCREGHLPAGTVDTRSITEVIPADVQQYRQCHFFAGIGGWPLALRWGGLEGVSGIWTGSPPCQPFSVAGKQKGYDDERHLAPVWAHLACECRPAIIFGEQVEAAIRTGWLDDLCDALEQEGYACASAILPACSVGAPHLRRRIYFGAVRLADLYGNGRLTRQSLQSIRPESDAEHGGAAGVMGDTHGQHEPAAGDETGRHDTVGAGGSGRMGHTCGQGPQGRPILSECPDQGAFGAHGLDGRSARPGEGHWEGADWLGCRDGRLRPVEPGTFPLADGLPERVGRLRGYGNAVVPQVATRFIVSFMDAVKELRDLG